MDVYICFVNSGGLMKINNPIQTKRGEQMDPIDNTVLKSPAWLTFIKENDTAEAILEFELPNQHTHIHLRNMQTYTYIEYFN